MRRCRHQATRWCHNNCVRDAAVRNVWQATAVLSHHTATRMFSVSPRSPSCVYSTRAVQSSDYSMFTSPHSLLARNGHALATLASASIVLGVLPARRQVAVVPPTPVALNLFQSACRSPHKIQICRGGERTQANAAIVYEQCTMQNAGDACVRVRGCLRSLSAGLPKGVLTARGSESTIKIACITQTAQMG